MPRANVKAYTKTVNGRQVKVTNHSKTTRSGRAKRNHAARRGWKNLQKAWKHAKKKKRAAAVFCGVLGTAQIGSFVALRGLSLAAVSVAVIASAVAGLAYAASSGGKLK